jgi:Holliday junction resolvase
MVSIKGSRRERELLEQLQRMGYVVHRVAGSGLHGGAACDLVAVKDGKAFFIEVKSRRRVYYPRDNAERLRQLIKIAKRAGAKPMLAVKLAYKPWRLIDLSKKVPQKVI